MKLKVLHSSDWHLGRLLYGRKRTDEFKQFLTWLGQVIINEEIDILLIAGDIFDTSTPNNQAQALYYQFLRQIIGSCCRHIVIIAGNHDSPHFLTAPQDLLKILNVHVIGLIEIDLADEVIVLNNAQGKAECIICAVPYLRDKELRKMQTGESIKDKDQQLIHNIEAHYKAVGTLAAEKRQALNLNIPIIGMGHLFSAGAKTLIDDGVRELYIGSLGHLGADIFPACFDYLALGHLHIPQAINKEPFKRYSGSPIAIGFGEAKQQKSICLIEFTQNQPELTLKSIPIFQKLRQIKGDWEQIHNALKRYIKENKSIWIEIIYQGQEVKTDLYQQIEKIIKDSPLEILRIQNKQFHQQSLQPIALDERLDNLTPMAVFERCLNAQEIPVSQQQSLKKHFKEICQTIENLN